MRRSASEIIRNLEMRVARLENKTQKQAHSKTAKKRMKVLHHYIDPETRDKEFKPLTLTLNELKSELHDLDNTEFHFNNNDIVFTGDNLNGQCVYIITKDTLLDTMLSERFGNIF